MSKFMRISADADPDAELRYTSTIYIPTYKTLTLIVCFFEAVDTNPGYVMAALISNNLLNLISGTVILLRSS